MEKEKKRDNTTNSWVKGSRASAVPKAPQVSELRFGSHTHLAMAVLSPEVPEFYALFGIVLRVTHRMCGPLYGPASSKPSIVRTRSLCSPHAQEVTRLYHPTRSSHYKCTIRRISSTNPHNLYLFDQASLYSSTIKILSIQLLL